MHKSPRKCKGASAPEFWSCYVNVMNFMARVVMALRTHEPLAAIVAATCISVQTYAPAGLILQLLQRYVTRLDVCMQLAVELLGVWAAWRLIAARLSSVSWPWISTESWDE